MSNGIDSTSTIIKQIIPAGTGVALAAPDHTTQILAVVVQIISLVIMFLKEKKKV
jgi:hypothetical protein